MKRREEEIKDSVKSSLQWYRNKRNEAVKAREATKNSRIPRQRKILEAMNTRSHMFLIDVIMEGHLDAEHIEIQYAVIDKAYDYAKESGNQRLQQETEELRKSLADLYREAGWDVEYGNGKTFTISSEKGLSEKLKDKKPDYSKRPYLCYIDGGRYGNPIYDFYYPIKSEKWGEDFDTDFFLIVLILLGEYIRVTLWDLAADIETVCRPVGPFDPVRIPERMP